MFKDAVAETGNAPSRADASVDTADRPDGIEPLNVIPTTRHRAAPAVRPGCYLPSDGCLSEYHFRGPRFLPAVWMQELYPGNRLVWSLL